MRVLVTLAALLAVAPASAQTPGGTAPPPTNRGSMNVPAQSQTTIASQQQVAVEVVSADQSGQTLTVRQPARLNVATTAQPEDTSIVTLPVDARAVNQLRTVRSGQEVLITCLNAPTIADTATGTTGTTGTTGITAAPGMIAGSGAERNPLPGVVAGSGAERNPPPGVVAGQARATVTPSTASTAPTAPATPATPAPVTITPTANPSQGSGVRPLSSLQGNCSIVAIGAASSR
jgi:hypothetical protein